MNDNIKPNGNFTIKTFKDIKTALISNVPLFVLLSVLIIVLYGNGLSGQFLSADDVPGIVNNPRVQDLPASLATWELEAIYPAVLYKLFGMNPLPFHLVSTLLHIVNTILVFIFIFVILDKKTATISAFLFAAHPVNSEAVLWISAYGYLILTLLALLIMISYALYRYNGDKRYLYTAVTVFILGLIFYRKPWILVVPVMTFLVEQFFIESKLNLKTIKQHLLFAIPAVIYVAVWLVGQYAFRISSLETLYYVNQEDQAPYINRIFYTGYMTAKLLLFPKDLTIYHEGEVVSSIAFFTIITGAISFLIAGLSIIFIIKSYKREGWKNLRYIGTSIILIYVTILFSFSPKVLVWSSAERYLYPAAVFFAIIVSIILIKLDHKYKNLGLLFGLILVLYSIKTFTRTNDWKNSKNLWIATQKVSPYSYRVYNNLGDIYASEGNYPEAIRNFQLSLQLSPGFADAVHNLGFTYYQMGNIELAIYYLNQSLIMNPMLYQSHYKLGVIEYQLKNFDNARAHFRKALEIKSDYGPVINALMVMDQNNLSGNNTSVSAPGN
ncbi:tetratricopeptide repeat protein [candidate division WWE3 bacterium]|jgi:tetratricopeptide (TPR) repeat protein|uniref:Tetratricopeptide repeat protein n=1 Tax=candidate division WWE3 bacterium TaxID=2053526 RepID=A0A3A4ZE14_UNCKA|nr:MAG: tetratricopeptide repeat protein [candidate division WWE3 bacterium]